MGWVLSEENAVESIMIQLIVPDWKNILSLLLHDPDVLTLCKPFDLHAYALSCKGQHQHTVDSKEANSP